VRVTPTTTASTIAVALATPQPRDRYMNVEVGLAIAQQCNSTMKNPYQEEAFIISHSKIN